MALLADFNACGRIVAGVASDRIGRTVTLVSVFLLQASNMVFFSGFSTFTGFVVGSAVVGFS